MAKEQAKMSMLDRMKKSMEETESGGGNNYLFFTKPGEVKKVRFLTEIDEAFYLKFHNDNGDDYKNPHYNHVCLEHFGKQCPTCKLDRRPKEVYVLSIYDYEYEKVSATFEKFNNFSFLPAVSKKYEKNGTITDRDFEIEQMGKGKSKSFVIDTDDKSKFKVKDVEPLTHEQVLDIIKNDRFRFVLPKGVDFDSLPDIEDGDDTPF